MTNHTETVLLVDDDAAFRLAVGRALERRGFAVLYAENGEQALHDESLGEWEAAVIDLRMPGMDGLELLTQLRERYADAPVIVLTGHGTISTAIEAIKRGAFHYLTKPCEISELEIYLRKALEERRIHREHERLRNAVQLAESSHGIIGKSPDIQRLLGLIDKVKDADSPVLVTGESGTGKELVARALHFQGIRKEYPFIAVNCATLKPELLENELFGHVAGAFTGATNRKEGLLAIADQGTLFVDEIADMNPNVQASLLRVIETGEFRPLGSTREQTTRVRLIAAVNRDLAAQVQAGLFRGDLFYRMNVIVIPTPPLREHADDIPLLVEGFLARSTARQKSVSFSPEALRALQAYRWPGNVRELFNICERAVLLRNGDLITAEEIAALLHRGSVDEAGFAPDLIGGESSSATPSPPLRTLEEVERLHIRDTLVQVDGNVSKAAEVLAIDRRTLQRKMARYGLRGEGS